jgi:succinyl-CoA synthetase beta subunit
MPRIYLDTNVWCRPFDASSGRIDKEKEAFYNLLKDVHKGKYVIVGSVVLETEIEDIEQKQKRDAVKKVINKFVSEKVEYISRKYKGIMDRTGLKVKILYIC